MEIYVDMNFLEKALNFIFPPVCGICGKMKESYLCKECQTKIENEVVFLNKTDKYVIANNIKNNTRNSNISDNIKYFSSHTYLFSYTTPIREKILQYKFKEQAYLSNMFSEFFVKNEKICGFLQKYDIIIPVPMTKKKVRKRGYNQSELIAKQLAKNIPNLKEEKYILIKVKENRTQSSLNRQQRQENVKDVYKLQNVEKIKEKNIIIFDDIYTTGATVNECAKVLMLGGAKKVAVITIAKD
jgi:competence protein ComFC